MACLPAPSFHFSARFLASAYHLTQASLRGAHPCTGTQRERGRLGSGQLNSTQFTIACVPHQSICPSHPANLPRPDWPLTVSRFSLILSFALHPSNAVTATHSGLASNSTNSASIQHPQHLAYAVMHDYLARPDVNRFQCIHRHLQRWINSLPGPMLITYIQRCTITGNVFIPSPVVLGLNRPTANDQRPYQRRQHIFMGTTTSMVLHRMVVKTCKNRLVPSQAHIIHACSIAPDLIYPG